MLGRGLPPAHPFPSKLPNPRPILAWPSPPCQRTYPKRTWPTPPSWKEGQAMETWRVLRTQSGQSASSRASQKTPQDGAQSSSFVSVCPMSSLGSEDRDSPKMATRGCRWVQSKLSLVFVEFFTGTLLRWSLQPNVWGPLGSPFSFWLKYF